MLAGTAPGGFPRGADIAGYLDYQGIPASAPRQKPQGAVPPNTRIVVYNGAEDRLSSTIAFLEQTFGVTSTTATDPTVRTDIIVTVGKKTPTLAAPPLS